MVTQKAISARIDKKLLEELELEASLGYQTKNRIINEALRFYFDLLDTRRKFLAAGNNIEGSTLNDQLTLRWYNRIANQYR